MSTSTTNQPTGNNHPLSPRLQKVIVLAITVPVVLAVILTVAQIYPATYAIGWLTNEDGEFPLKAAILLNAVLALLIVLALAIVALVFKLLFIRK